MDPATIIFAIGLPVALITVPVFAFWTKHREKLAELGASQQAAKNRELEERMRNLERIVTDKGYDIGTQIEALRGTHRMEETAPAHQLEGNRQ